MASCDTSICSSFGIAEDECCLLWGVPWPNLIFIAICWLFAGAAKYVVLLLFAVLQTILTSRKAGAWFEPIRDNLITPSKYLLGIGLFWLGFNLLDIPQDVNNVLVWFVLIPFYFAWLWHTSEVFDTFATITTLELRAKLKRKRGSSDAMEEQNRYNTVTSAYKEGIRIIKYVAFLFITAIILQTQSVSVVDALVRASLLGLALIFALQPWLRNMIGGIFIFTDRKFFINDTIRVVGIEGVVHAVTLRHTTLRREDNSLVTVPNSRILEQPVANYSKRETRLLEIRLKVRPDTPASKLRQLVRELERVLQGLHRTLTSHPKNPLEGDFFVALAGMFEVLIWTYTSGEEVEQKAHADIKTEIMIEVTETFERLGVVMETSSVGNRAPQGPERKLLHRKMKEEAKNETLLQLDEDHEDDDQNLAATTILML